MNRRILIFTVLISNIAFSAVLPVDMRDVSEIREIGTNKNRVSICSAVSRHLHKKGLDEDVADERVKKHLRYNEYENSLMAENILNNFNELNHKDIISFVSESVLFQKNVDLSSYKQIVGLVHKSNKVSMDSMTLKKIEKISFENKNIKSNTNNTLETVLA